MRRTDREVTDPAAIDAIIRACPCCRLGLRDGEGVYLVPLNFGFANVDGQRTFYFHSAPEGHKIDLLRQAKTVAFELDCGCAVTPGTTACSHSANYRSVMGQGRVRFLETRMDKRAALTEIMRQNTGKDDWTFPDEADRPCRRLCPRGADHHRKAARLKYRADKGPLYQRGLSALRADWGEIPRRGKPPLCKGRWHLRSK